MPPARDRAIDGAGLETGLGDGEVDEILRNAFFAHDALNHCPVAAGALERMKQGVVALGGIGEEVDVGGDVVVDDKRQVGLGGGQIGVGLGHNVGIDDKGDVAGSFGGSVFRLGGEAVACFRASISRRVDLVDDAVEFVLERRGGSDVDAAGEHEIDGIVEIGFGLGQIAVLVGGIAQGIGLLDLLDERLNPLLRCTWLGRRGWRR